MRRVSLLLIVAAVTAVATKASGQSFTGLGFYPGGFPYSIPRDLSEDGVVVVGESYSPSGQIAFRWTADGGMERIVDLPSTVSRARGSWRLSDYCCSSNHRAALGEDVTSSSIWRISLASSGTT